jgi:predicted RNA-binding protein Jag
MDWILTSGDTVEEAQEIALEQLSVTMEDVEFETISEGNKSFFSFRRRSAQIRARLKPLTPPQKLERVYKGKKNRYEAKKTKSNGSNRTSATKKPADIRKPKSQNQSSTKNLNKARKVDTQTVSRSRTLNERSVKLGDLNETNDGDGVVRRKRTLSVNSIKNNDPKSIYSNEISKKTTSTASEKSEVSNSNPVTTKSRTRKIAQ